MAIFMPQALQAGKIQPIKVALKASGLITGELIQASEKM